MSKRILLVSLALIALVFGFAVKDTHGQAVYGSIVGTVTDPQGAGVADAKIVVLNINKGNSDTVASNESGYFSVTHLIPDVYKVHIEAAGFKAYDVTSVTVLVDTVVRVDASLQVGAVTQTVEVTSEVPQLQTEKSDVSTTFQSTSVESLPIYNRNFTTFQLLSPGNQRLNGWNHAASENPQGSQQILTQGQHFAGTAFELDGTDNQDPILGIIVINPSLESINEVKITAQDYDAEFGKAIGAVVTSQTKSGTNEFHGTVFDFERSNSNFARNPFKELNTVPKGNWNQFGGAVGGPIIKNKLFFFGDYQGLRSHVGASASDRILTANERTGDLRDLGINIYDPYQTSDLAHCNLVLGENGQPIPLSASQRTQFMGNDGLTPNVIPTCRLSPQTQNLLKLFPGPNQTPANALLDNYFGSGSNVLDGNQFDVRSDYRATEKLQIFGRYSYQKFTRSGPGLYGTLLGGAALPADPSVGSFAGNSNSNDHSIAAGFDYTFSPTLLTDFRFGYFRYNVQTAPGGVGTTPATDAGIPGLNIDTQYTSGMPAFTINSPGSSAFYFGYSLGPAQCNCPLTESEHQYQFVNNWTKIKGNHSIKFGADLRYAYNLRVPSDAHRAGQLDFNNDLTAGPTGGGTGIASFLLGDVSHFNRYVSNSTNAYETQPRIFFYGQDTWRITNKLTFNFGIRWEMYIPESAAGAGLGGWLDPATGEMRVAGQTGVDLRGNTTTDYKHFAPRLGIAYQVDSKTVVRLGYGRSYDIGVFGSIFGHSITQNLPVLGSQDYSGGASVAQDFNTAFFLQNGPASFNPNTALATNNCNVISDPGGLQPNGSYIPTMTTCYGPNGRPLLRDGVFSRVRPFNNRLPTVDAWNVSVQRQVTPTLTLTVAYVGNKGTHTMIGDNPAYGINNRTNVGYMKGCTLDPLQPTEPNQATCTRADGTMALPPQLRTPYYLRYGWTQGIDYFGNDANNNYNALQITADKRLANGLLLNASYTFQHANYYSNNGYFNIDPTSAYGPNANYRNHVFILTQVYQLPFGKGKRFFSDAGRVADLLIGGWSLNSSWNISSGLPFTPGLADCSATIDNGPCRPNIVGPIGGGSHSGNREAGGYWLATSNSPTVYLNTLCAESNGWGQSCTVGSFGSAQTNSFRGPKFFNADAALFKDFDVTEKYKLQFQFQAFNVFNHTNLNLPDTCVDCRTQIKNPDGSISYIPTGFGIHDIAFGSQMRRLQFGLKFAF